MPFESFIVSERLPVEDRRKAASVWAQNCSTVTIIRTEDYGSNTRRVLSFGGGNIENPPAMGGFQTQNEVQVL